MEPYFHENSRSSLIELSSEVSHQQHQSHRRSANNAGTRSSRVSPVLVGGTNDRVADFNKPVATSLFRRYPSVLPKSQAGLPVIETVEPKYRWTPEEKKGTTVSPPPPEPASNNPAISRAAILKSFRDVIDEASSPSFHEKTLEATLRADTAPGPEGNAGTKSLLEKNTNSRERPGSGVTRQPSAEADVTGRLEAIQKKITELAESKIEGQTDSRSGPMVPAKVERDMPLPAGIRRDSMAAEMAELKDLVVCFRKNYQYCYFLIMVQISLAGVRASSRRGRWRGSRTQDSLRSAQQWKRGLWRWPPNRGRLPQAKFGIGFG